MFNLEYVFMSLTWVLRALFWTSLIPQIIMNFRVRSTNGMSELTLWGYFSGYTASTIYSFCLDMPLAYKIMTPISLVTVAFMIGQQMFFDKKFDMFLHYGFTVLIAAIGIPFAISNPIYVGNIFGWGATFIWMTYQLPQVLKIHIEKSVTGLSFALLALLGLGNLMETATAVFMDFPVQTVISGIRGIFLSTLMTMQYFLYHK